MKTLQRTLAVLLLSLLTSAHAADSWQKDGKPAANTASMKSKAGFGAQLFLTQDTGVFQKWNTPEPPKIAPVTVARLEGGHFVHLENAERFNALLLAEWRSLRA